MNKPKLEVKKIRGKFFICMGKSRLSQGLKSEEQAKKELEENFSLYKYWSGSCSVSVENAKHKIIEVIK